MSSMAGVSKGRRTVVTSRSLASKAGVSPAVAMLAQTTRSTWARATSRRSRWVMNPISMRFFPMDMAGLRLAMA